MIDKDNIKETLKNTPEKISHLADKIQTSLNDENTSTIFGILAYIPFIGPMITYLYKKKSKFTKQHLQNAFYIQITFVLISFIVWFTENIPVISSLLKSVKFIPYITNAITYINWLLLTIMSFIGISFAIRNKLWEAPFYKKYFENIKTFFFQKKEKFNKDNLTTHPKKRTSNKSKK